MVIEMLSRLINRSREVSRANQRVVRLLTKHADIKAALSVEEFCVGWVNRLC